MMLSVTYSLDSGNIIQTISHDLINTTENIRKSLDDGNIGCRPLLAKLNH